MALLPRAGSWGTPEFGITETIGNLFGINPNQQGGSNLSGRSIYSPLPSSQTPSSLYGAGGTMDTYQPSGQVLGSGTQQVQPSGNTNTGGGTGGGSGSLMDQWRALGNTGDLPVGWNGPGNGGQSDPYAGLKNEIGSAWDQYLASLGGQGQYIDQQRAAQEGTANTSLAEGQRQIGEQKATSLRDIQNTARNAFTAGNNYLGSLGASDSSAANQYKFAVDQQQMKQVGDLNNFVNSANQKIESEHGIQLQSIAQWFAQQQQALQQQVAQGALNKAQDIQNLSKGILDQAIAWKQQLETNSMNQKNALAQWAMNNNTTVAGMTGAMGQLGQQQFGGLNINQTQPTNKSLFGGASNINDKYDPNNPYGQ